MPPGPGSGESDPSPVQGWVATGVRSEFPGIGISSVEFAGASGRSPEPVRKRLRDLSDRFYGSHAIHMRERPIPWAYRVFFRQIGLDPDKTRTPVEELALERIKRGGFPTGGPLTDAITIATIETGVALRALDAGLIEGALGIRDTAPGEALEGTTSGDLPQGTLVIADQRRPLCFLFGPGGEHSGAGPKSERIVIAAIQVGGVPQIAVEEAFWTVASVMAVS